MKLLTSARTLTAIAVLVLLNSTLSAQADLENVIVETYYISDAADATDTIGGGLAVGSRTYRVYLDLCTDCALRSVYGDMNHALLISSTAPFFNHLDRGQTFGHQVSNSALDEGTVALDSWLSLGAGSNQRAGVLKAEDSDGSIIGGPNNDGGSAQVAQGLLTNTDPDAGIPLTDQDGLATTGGATVLPPNFNLSGNDPGTVFRDSTIASEFMSFNTRVGCSSPGVKGPTTENKVLVAQLTTTGDLTFRLNIEVEKPGGQVVRYVSSDSVLLPGETANGLLIFPPQCGCTDPNFLEFNPAAGCDDGSCQTTIIFGCLDTLACNFDPSANFNVTQLCCYGPGNCNGLDISVLCPNVGITGSNALTNLSVYPNPVGDRLEISVEPSLTEETRFVLLDLLGRVVLHGELDPGPRTHSIDLSSAPSGSYVLQLHRRTGSASSVQLIKL